MNYTIFKGWKYALPPFPLFSWKKKVFEWRNVMFDNSAIYDIGRDELDIQKLFGVAWGSVHSNSARFGFRNIKGVGIEILAYCYDECKRLNTIVQNNEKTLCFVDLNQPITRATIFDNGTHYLFELVYKGHLYCVAQNKKHQSGNLAWICRPHFEPKAPHKMKFKIGKYHARK